MTRKKIEDFTDLIVWQKSYEFVLNIYKLTRTFPTEERYGLVTQMRRCTVSIPANIAEGFRRRGRKNKIMFYNISQGSIDELRYFLILSKDLGYIKQNDELMKKCSEISKLLKGLIESASDYL